MKTALVIMAAGIGSRFGGGIKQLAAVGPNGEIIMDYSIHDAIEAGFDKIVFIIRHDIEDAFKEAIGDRIEKICAELGVEIDYAFQALENVPEGFSAVPVTESLNILLRGLESEMAQITAEDLRITVDLSGITEPGVHTVPVTVQVANYANVGVKGSYQIVVDVERLP